MRKKTETKTAEQKEQTITSTYYREFSEINKLIRTIVPEQNRVFIFESMDSRGISLGRDYHSFAEPYTEISFGPPSKGIFLQEYPDGSLAVIVENLPQLTGPNNLYARLRPQADAQGQSVDVAFISSTDELSANYTTEPFELRAITQLFAKEERPITQLFERRKTGPQDEKNEGLAVLTKVIHAMNQILHEAKRQQPSQQIQSRRTTPAFSLR